MIKQTIHYEVIFERYEEMGRPPFASLDSLKKAISIFKKQKQLNKDVKIKLVKVVETREIIE